MATGLVAGGPADISSDGVRWGGAGGSFEIHLGADVSTGNGELGDLRSNVTLKTGVYQYRSVSSESVITVQGAVLIYSQHEFAGALRRPRDSDELADVWIYAGDPGPSGLHSVNVNLSVFTPDRYGFGVDGGSVEFYTTMTGTIQCFGVSAMGHRPGQFGGNGGSGGNVVLDAAGGTIELAGNYANLMTAGIDTSGSDGGSGNTSHDRFGGKYNDGGDGGSAGKIDLRAGRFVTSEFARDASFILRANGGNGGDAGVYAYAGGNGGNAGPILLSPDAQGTSLFTKELIVGKGGAGANGGAPGKDGTVLTGASIQPIQPEFDWSVPDRYGLDENHNGRIDLRNSYEYVHPDGYTLLLDASRTQSDVPIADDGYQWTVTGPGLDTPRPAMGMTTQVSGLQNGAEYTVSLTVRAQNGTEASTTEQAKVRDILIVALGDSYSSGEGNPVVPQKWKGKKLVSKALWGDGVSSGMETENRQAHRSTLAASSQTALAIEKSDPHSSVTFVMLSTSGATVMDGLIYQKAGIENPKYKVPAQISELKQIVGDRAIDAMTLSVGGNDIGFTEIAKELFGKPIVVRKKTRNTILSEFKGKLKQLPTMYRLVNTRLRGNFSIGNVVITDYPDPTCNDEGKPAALLTDVVPPFGISKSDAGWLQKNVLAPLNGAVKAAAQANGWQFAGPLAPDFLKHGYSAKKTWYVTNTVGRQTIGVMPGFPPLSSGTLHPNGLGHKNIAEHLLPILEHDIETLV